VVILIAAFPVMSLSSISSDLLFNVLNLVITTTFFTSEQALAGGVFNTVSQLGNSIGPSVTAAIASSVTSAANNSNTSDPEAILKGYRAAFWTCFGRCHCEVLDQYFRAEKEWESGIKERIDIILTGLSLGAPITFPSMLSG